MRQPHLKARGQGYDNLTADIHACIINTNSLVEMIGW